MRRREMNNGKGKVVGHVERNENIVKNVLVHFMDGWVWMNE